MLCYSVNNTIIFTYWIMSMCSKKMNYILKGAKKGLAFLRTMLYYN